MMQELEVPLEKSVEQALPALSPEDTAKALESLLRSAKDEDRAVRDWNLNLFRRLDYYWNNILDIFQDSTTGTWRVPDWNTLQDELPPRLINIYRPYGEAIVAVLSTEVPPVYYHPDDADNPDDIETSRAYRAITELLQLHNDAAMQVVKLIVILFNYGTVYGYNYYHADPKFGVIKKPQVDIKDVMTFETYCPQCGNPLDAGMETPQMSYFCESCGYEGPAESIESFESLPQIVGWDESPKGTICQKLLSGLNIKTPMYTSTPEENGYLIYSFIQATAMLKAVFNDEENKIHDGVNTDWEGWAKIPVNYLNQFPDNAANVDCFWCRPWHFHSIKDANVVSGLITAYPDGCYAIFVNDRFMAAYNENMDDHWTISPNPMGMSLIARPLGENLATIQDIRAQLVEIELQTAEFGIPEMFADPNVLDFKKYGESRSKPGMVTPIKPRAGKAIADSFHTSKPAILSQEIDPLRQHIDQDAQFVSGAFPSMYGANMPGGSKTASEYAQSKASALQRLGSINKIKNSFWAQFQARSAVEYANVLKEMGIDERFTKRDGENFVNNWIRVASLQGKVGRVESEVTDGLPSSWAQKKDAWFQLLGLNNELINSVLFHPRNTGIAKEATGLKDFYVPGEDSRVRQLQEFQLLAQGIPVPINPELDNNEVHIETLKSILEGPLRDGLTEQGFMASMQHLMEHQQYVAMMQEQQMKAEMDQKAAQQGSAPDTGSQKEK